MVSYFELCFAFQLHYSSGAQITAELIQKRIAKYGDDTGTLTNMRRTTAISKIQKYVNFLSIAEH